MHDPYVVLGLTRSATAQQVKQAYKKLALQWHPDLCPAQERAQAEAAFKNIAAAYARISKGEQIKQSRIRYSSHAGTRRMPAAETSGFTNVMVAVCLCLPLVLTGVQFGKTYPKWEEQSWRRHGIMSPPVNPWLKDDQRATEFSHVKRWQQGASAGQSQAPPSGRSH